MRAYEVLQMFGAYAKDAGVENLFSLLGTLRRPRLADAEQRIFHDWVLVRRQGVELGFADSEYQLAEGRSRWGQGQLLLTQAYFYAGFNEVQSFAGELPFGLSFADSRSVARTKLMAFEATRHSYRNDTWDVDGYRLSVTYANDSQRIERIACRVLAAPVPREGTVVFPALRMIVDAFGTELRSSQFIALWGNAIDDERRRQADEEREIDLTRDFGATLGIVGDRGTALFRSITLHRNRDMESAGWSGELPHGLDFEDSPDILFSKIPSRPAQQSDSALTGHAVWHFDAHTLHVLYSNLDNRLLRIKLIAPGTWKCVEDD